MLALRVPCDARMSLRDANSLPLGQRIPKTPTHPVFLGESEWDLKITRRWHGVDFDFDFYVGFGFGFGFRFTSEF